MSRNKKAFLKTMESVGSKLFTWCVAVSVLLPMFKPEYGKIWVVMVPVGLAGLAASFWAAGQLNE